MGSLIGLPIWLPPTPLWGWGSKTSKIIKNHQKYGIFIDLMIFRGLSKIIKNHQKYGIFIDILMIFKGFRDTLIGYPMDYPTVGRNPLGIPMGYPPPPMGVGGLKTSKIHQNHQNLSKIYDFYRFYRFLVIFGGF